MGGISAVDLGFWHEIESPAINGEMSKGSGVNELSIDFCPPAGGKVLGRGGEVR